MSEPMTEREALLPCPFCGEGQSVVEPWFDDVAHRWRVGCGRCGCSTGTHPTDKTPDPAIAAWNRRPHISQPAQAVDVEKASDAWREAAAAILGKHSRLFRYVCEEAEKLTAALKDSR
jgi:hypothetical protein